MPTRASNAKSKKSPASKPAAKVARPAAQPAARPVSKKVTRPARKPAAKPTPKAAPTATTRATLSPRKSMLAARNPATGEIIGEVPITPMDDMAEIFAQARQAQQVWANVPFEKRRDQILRVRDYLLDNAESIAKVLAANNGKTLYDAMNTEVIPCILSIDWYAKKAKSFLKKTRLPASNVLFSNKRAYLLRIPLGVVGIISPWNYPLAIPLGEIIMGLMAGNAILFKTASETCLVGAEIEKAIKAAGLPHGLFHLIVGSGPQVSTAFFEHGIDKIFFTGSVPTGKTLMQQAVENVTPLSLELGGNDAMIVLEDANIERAVNGAIWAGFQNSGQSCAGVQRILVHKKVADEFMQLIKQRTETLRQGVDTGKFNIDIGAMTTQRQRATVAQAVDDALTKGAKILAQSTVRADDDANFYPCTILTNVKRNMTVLNDEVFGPVMTIQTFSEDDEAIRMANDSVLGLTSSIWTMDNTRAKLMAEKLQTGITTVNDHLLTHGVPETPWLGWKQSGLGATHSHLGLEEMTRPKVVHYDIAPQLNANLWWFPARRIKYELLVNTVHILFSKTFQDRSKALKQVLPNLIVDPLLREKLSYVLQRGKHRSEIEFKHLLNMLKK